MEFMCAEQVFHFGESKAWKRLLTAKDFVNPKTLHFELSAWAYLNKILARLGDGWTDWL
ncbi:MAG: hypothetical protein PVG48_02960 [Candidatus Bathyarchaeota archaeon]|jgi:hypothetical protein